MQPKFTHLSTEEQTAFSLYKGNSPYEEMPCFADYLNTTLANDEVLKPSWEKQAQILDRIILSAWTEEDITLYRAMLDAYLPQLKAGVKFVYPPYMSTATDECAVQRHFSCPFRGLAGALLRIRCTEGANILNLEIKKSFGGDEQEFLLPRKAQFKVTKIEVIEQPSAMKEYMGVYANNYCQLRIYEMDYLGVA